MQYMAVITHMARITGPVAYRAASGKQLTIPLGPCLVEQSDPGQVDVIWGAQGQNSAALPLLDLESAENLRHLVMLGQAS